MHDRLPIFISLNIRRTRSDDQDGFCDFPSGESHPRRWALAQRYLLATLKLRPTQLLPVRICLLDIVVQISPEIFPGVLIPTDTKFPLVNEPVRTLDVGQYSVSYPVGAKSAILRGILCGIFVKIALPLLRQISR